MIDRNTLTAERVEEAGLQRFISRIAVKHALENVAFLCIGTDRSTGDSLGPLVGTMLEEKGFKNVFGTLKDPCDSDRLPQVLSSLEHLGTIIAVDACLGKPDNVGAFLVKEGPLVPARSVNRGFAPVGDYSIAGVVNAASLKPYWTLQSTSLYRVMEMAGQIAGAISGQWRIL